MAGHARAQATPTDDGDGPAATPTNILDLLPDDAEGKFDQSFWTLREGSFTFWRARQLDDGSLECVYNTGYNDSGFYTLARWVYGRDGRLVSYQERCEPANSAYNRRTNGAWQGDEFVITTHLTIGDSVTHEPQVTRVPEQALASSLQAHALPLVFAYHQRRGSAAYAFSVAELMPTDNVKLYSVENKGRAEFERDGNAYAGQTLEVLVESPDATGTRADPDAPKARFTVLIDDQGKARLTAYAMRCGVSTERTATRAQVAEAFGLKDIEAMEDEVAGAE